MNDLKSAAKLALEALRMPCNFWNKVQFIRVTEAIKALEAALAKQEQGEPFGKMTARRAEMFMSRFKHEEKMLGPNEQAALDYVIDILVAKQEVLITSNSTELEKQEQGDPVEIHQYSFKELGKKAPWYDGKQDQTKWPHHIYNHRIVYTAPPAKQEQGEPVAWKSVSDFEIYEMYNEPRSDTEMLLFARELETELKRRNKCAALKP